jgi:glucose-1-phosphate cytidylyltransferase
MELPSEPVGNRAAAEREQGAMSMKTVILAGGLGTRLSEETSSRPKPMVTVGGRPILWHLMKSYADQGYSDFVIALGYRGDVIKEYLLNLRSLSSSFTIDTSTGHVNLISNVPEEEWSVTALETGESCETGGRVLQCGRFIDEDTFMVTYGDGLADVDVRALVDFHRSHRGAATVTAVRPPARFGRLTVDGSRVTAFGEKPTETDDWINGGFFVLDRRALDYIDGNSTVFEREPLERLAAAGELHAWRHEGFWQPMDTLRERRMLEDIWATGSAPWLRRPLP